MAQKILFVLPNLQGGGAERVVITLMNRLDRSHWEPVLAAGSTDGELRDTIHPSISIHDLGSQRVRSALPQLLKLVWRLKPAILFSTLTHLNLAVGLLRPFLPRPLKLVAREGNIPSQSLPHESHPRLYKLAYRRLYRRFDAVIAQSTRMAADMRQLQLVPPAKVRVIYNPVDTAEILRCSQQDAAPEWPAAGVRLLAAGRLDRQKGFDLLLQAVAEVSRPCSLVLLGEGELRADLEAMIEELGLSGRVNLQGFVRNPYRWMAAADLFVLSSRYEGFPNVVLESLSCGTPVAAYGGDTSADEIIRDGVDGILAAPGSVSALHTAIQTAIDKSWDAAALQQSVEQRFGTARIMRAYHELFRSIL